MYRVKSTGPRTEPCVKLVVIFKFIIFEWPQSLSVIVVTAS